MTQPCRAACPWVAARSRPAWHPPAAVPAVEEVSPGTANPLVASSPPRGDTHGTALPLKRAGCRGNERWVSAVHLSEQDFQNLLEFRTMLRRFERWSEQQARAVGLTPAQHQLLLAVKGHPDRRGPTIRELAEYLLLRHHSTVELVNRVESGGLARRRGDPDDARIVRVTLTQDGEDRLGRLTTMHVEELRRLAPILDHLVEEAE